MERTNKLPRILPFLLAALAGCTIVDSSTIPVGQQRPAISPSDVRIYLQPPSTYEEVAIVSAKAGHDFKKEQSLTDAAMQRLREEAARLGANGIILQGVQSRSEPTVTTGIATGTTYGSAGPSSSTGTIVGVSHGDGYNKVSGIAIYVPNGK